MDMRLELVLLPVSDVDRAKAFYTEKLGFSLDVDTSPTPEFRDIAAAREALVARGVEIGEVRHFAREHGEWRPGPDPEHANYNSFADFADPDGNTWLLQEVDYRAGG